MKTKSKSELGLISLRCVQPARYYPVELKHEIIQEYLKSNKTKQAIWEKFTGFGSEHGQIIKWMRSLGYEKQIINPSRIFRENNESMKKRKMLENASDNLFEQLQLEKRIKELESQLKDAELKAITFSTMIDIAEKEFNIPIRKKYNTKPSKK